MASNLSSCCGTGTGTPARSAGRTTGLSTPAGAGPWSSCCGTGTPARSAGRTTSLSTPAGAAAAGQCGLVVLFHGVVWCRVVCHVVSLYVW